MTSDVPDSMANKTQHSTVNIRHGSETLGTACFWTVWVEVRCGAVHELGMGCIS
jgi:hypothetical protein